MARPGEKLDDHTIMEQVLIRRGLGWMCTHDTTRRKASLNCHVALAWRRSVLNFKYRWSRSFTRCDGSRSTVQRADVMVAWHVVAFTHCCSPLQTVRDKCFKACLGNPGSSLSSSDQKCLNRCMDRYQDVSAFAQLPGAPGPHTGPIGSAPHQKHETRARHCSGAVQLCQCSPPRVHLPCPCLRFTSPQSTHAYLPATTT